jgi:hypothetical protein
MLEHILHALTSDSRGHTAAVKVLSLLGILILSRNKRPNQIQLASNKTSIHIILKMEERSHEEEYGVVNAS